jgi:hypothetical protein
MAQINETIKPLDNTVSDLAIVFDLRGNGTLVQRLHVSVVGLIDRDDGRNSELRQFTPAHVDDNIPGFNDGDAAALRSLLKKVYDAAKAGV